MMNAAEDFVSGKGIIDNSEGFQQYDLLDEEVNDNNLHLAQENI